jgi:tryptophan synthase alpha chain
MVAEFRKTNTTTPVVLMGYLNPIEARGLDRFAERAEAAGVDGVLIVDLAVEEAPEVAPRLKSRGLDLIFLLAPTSPDARIAAIAEQASGYLYYVSLKGVTGAATLDIDSVGEKLATIREHTALPLAVGFGIRDAETAALVGKVADGVVVGSALVGTIEQHGHAPEMLPALIEAQLGAMRAALNAL